MMKTVSVEQYRKLAAKKKKQGRYKVAPKPDRTFDGTRFASKHEMEAYKDLLAERVPGRVILLQVPFRLPGNVKYVADFVTLEPHLCHSHGFLDGPPKAVYWYEVHVIDAKGHRTREYIDKKKLVESLYPWTIEEV